ncbi:11117_t:CDS:1, partial [Scutellospora calospora]
MYKNRHATANRPTRIHHPQQTNSQMNKQKIQNTTKARSDSIASEESVETVA